MKNYKVYCTEELDRIKRSRSPVFHGFIAGFASAIALVLAVSFLVKAVG